MRLLLVLALAAPLTGCLGLFADDVGTAGVDAQQQIADDILGDAGRDKLVDAAAILPKNYSFPQQRLLPPVTVQVKGAVAPDANGGYEAERDEGGIDYNNKVHWEDVSALLPPGQPAELVLKLTWDASEANSADLDIAIDVPGTRTTHSAVSETWNWNLAVKQAVVNTIGVEGEPARVGVQVSSATITRGFAWTLEVQATYVKDVLTPHHAWALDVPSDAGGLILESEKAGGDEHVTSQFVVIDPDDNLVAFVDFNDLSIPTQSVFVPTSRTGQHVVYAYHMHGGFLRVKADVPLGNVAAAPLPLAWTETVDLAAPAPGVAAKDVFNGSAAQGLLPKDDAGATRVTFTPAGPFPLRVEAFVRGQVVGMTKVTLKSPLGLVDQMTVIGRYQDERGSLGYTSAQEGPDNVSDWKNVQKGQWTADIVNDSPAVEVGHAVLTYQR
ncbi:MAG TPA: hypothetical protein VNX21_00145 [Candidatus Thermoplasmatota archaeon]|nr:hypothetical protein [Candidatus Thermoplasmatota archaeon]